MKKLCFLLTFLLTIGFVGFSEAAKYKDSYVIVTTENVLNDEDWVNVVNKLQKRHKAEILTYSQNVDEVLEGLKKLRPRYVAIVEKPENIGRDYVIALNQLSRKVDDDVFEDYLWGIITGYDADAAMRMLTNTEKPFVIKTAVATIQELENGKWFDELAYVKDHQPIGKYGIKNAGDTKVQEFEIEERCQYKGREVPDLLTRFLDFYENRNADLLVTASHATENNLEMPGSVGNIKCKDGRLITHYPGEERFINDRKGRMVYLPIGNCLIGNVNNTRNSMAIAWMNSQNAATYVGYVVTTWHGRNGWGGLKYLLTSPARYTIAEAFYMNRQDMLNQLNEWNPKYTTAKFNYDEEYFYTVPAQILKETGKKATKDQLGFFHDRDVLAYYGDPKWNVRLKELKNENDYTVDFKVKAKKCTITIKTKENFSLERMFGDKFKQEHVLDLPFNYFFPRRLNNPRLADGDSRHIIVDENFVLLYNPDFKPNSTYTIVLDID